METYEKKYKEALGWMQSLYDGLHGATKEDAEHYFPELKESEDEESKKWILEYLHDGLRKSDEQFKDYFKTAIAWLEKQGEKSTIIDIDKMVNEYSQTKDGDFGFPVNCMIRAYRQGINDALRLSLNLEKQGKEKHTCGNCQTFQDLHQNCPYSPIYKYKDLTEAHKHLNDETNCDFWLEKQGEQKPTDKVKQKFKVGDWVVNKFGYVWRVDSFDKKNYQVHNEKGDNCYFKISKQDEFHLWTIDDAKDGDVLYSLDSKQPFIFKHRKPHEQAAVYCGINIYGKFFVENTNDYIITADKYIPADKFQRNLLFQKMKEAGYEWNAEKKELKKIVQKSAWSEKEKDLMYDTLSNLTELKDRYGEEYGNVGKCIDWLRSLKEKLTKTKGGEI